MDDSALAIRAAAGDHEAFTELVDRYGGRILAVATRIAGGRARGEDFCQEVFLHLLGALARYDAGRPFVPWLMRVTTHLCLNRLRSERRRPAVSLDAVRETRGDFVAAQGPGPADQVATLDEHELVRQARDALPPNYRAILALRYESGLSHEELAAALGGIPIGTVKNRLHRARAALAARLERARRNDA